MAIEKIIDHLPFLDGSGRRRFVAGGIILIGIALQNTDTFKAVLRVEDLDIGDILGSPLIAGGAVLLVYAIGSLAEMLGELSIVRAASGIFFALQFPGQVVTWEAVPSRHWFYGFLIIIIKLSLYVTVVPFMVLYFAAAGFVGYTKFTIDIRSRASDRAWAVFEKLPDAAQRGLHQPVGNDSDFAQKCIVDMLTNEPNRKWARRQIVRAKDVAATITALQVVLLYTLLSSGDWGNSEQKVEETVPLKINVEAVISATNKFQGYDKDILSFFALESIRIKVKKYKVFSRDDFPDSRIAELRTEQQRLKSRIRNFENDIVRLDRELKELKNKLATKTSREQKSQVQRSVEIKVGEQIKDRNDIKITLERRVTTFTKQVEDIDKFIKLVTEGEVANLTNNLQDAMIDYRDYFRTVQEDKVLNSLILTGVWLFFLPLYLGYFTTLRNAIAAILEAVAAADNSAVVPEGAE